MHWQKLFSFDAMGNNYNDKNTLSDPMTLIWNWNAHWTLYNLLCLLCQPNPHFSFIFCQVTKNLWFWKEQVSSNGNSLLAGSHLLQSAWYIRNSLLWKRHIFGNQSCGLCPQLKVMDANTASVVVVDLYSLRTISISTFHIKAKI